MKNTITILLFLFILSASSCEKYYATCTKYDENNEELYTRTVENKSSEYVRGWIDGFEKQVAKEGLTSSCTNILKK